MTAIAPAFRNGVRSLTDARAGRYDAGNVSVCGYTPQGRYSSAQRRTLVGHSTSAIFPCRPVRSNVGFVPANTISPATPAADVCPEYGKYDVTGIFDASPDADTTVSAERFASQRGKV